MASTTGGETMESLTSLPQHHQIQANDAPAEPCYFWRVPLEIRDTIYELCYGEQREIKLRSRAAWLIKERRGDRRERRDRVDFVSTAFPTTFMESLLVSKQFFEEALRIWAQTKVLYIDISYKLNQVLQTGSAIERHLLRHIKSLRTSDRSSAQYTAIAKMSSLQHVTTIPLDEYWVHRDSEKSIWYDDFTDVELAKDRHISLLLTYRGLRSLTYGWQEPYRTLNPSEQSKWESFKQQVRKLVDDVVSQPKEQMNTVPPHWTFAQALEEASKAGQATKTLPSSNFTPAVPPPQRPSPLTDNEVPETETGLLRLFMTRPQALTAWLKDSKKARRELTKLQQSAVPLD